MQSKYKILSHGLAEKIFFRLEIICGSEQGTFSGQIECPFVTSQFPDIDAIQTELGQFVVDMKLLERGTPEYTKFERSKFAYLAGFTLLGTDSREEVSDTAKHIALLFALDTFVDCKESLYRKSPDLLFLLFDKLRVALKAGIDGVHVTPDEDDPPFVQNLCIAFYETGKSLQGKSSELFQNAFASYGQGLQSEADFRHSGTWLHLFSYTNLRERTSAVFDVLEYILSIKGMALSGKVRENICFIDAGKCANQVVSFSNDLFSLNQEIDEGTQENVVRVLQHARHLSLSEAVSATVSLINESVANYLQQKGLFLKYFRGTSDEREQAMKVFTYLERLMKGNIEWSKITKRYNE